MLARLVFLSTLLTSSPRAEVIDRIAVTLDNQIITESEVAREIRLSTLLNGDPLVFSPEARRKAADRLVEQKLIRREIELGRYLEPNKDEVAATLKQIQKQRFRDLEDYRQSLEKYGVSEDDLNAHVLWQLTLLRFIDARFRPGIQVSDEEIRAYFDREQRKLEGTADPGKPQSFEDLRDQIGETLINQIVDQQLDDWLAAARKRTRIVFHPEAFQ
jgi:peptidyl-prolyl cis-trans isomerase SurA